MMDRRALGVFAAIALLLFLVAGLAYFFFVHSRSVTPSEASISMRPLGIKFTQNETLMKDGGLVWASPEGSDPPIIFYSTPALNKLGETCDPSLVASGNVKGRWVGAIEKLPASVTPDPSSKVITRVGDSNIVAISGFDLCVPYGYANMEVATQKAVEESLQSASAE
jgi:hypothetical protein